MNALSLLSRKAVTMKLSTYRDKVAGAFYGFCIGDAMGATTEFMTAKQIKEEYGLLHEIVG